MYFLTKATRTDSCGFFIASDCRVECSRREWMSCRVFP